VPILHAIILGITQGLSEFLPISSSGHLELVPWLFGWDDFAADPDLETTFDVALHMGTLVGAVAYFRSDIVRLGTAGLGALSRRSSGAGVGSVSAARSAGSSAETGVELAPGGDGTVGDRDASLAWLLLLSAVPAGITGLLFEDTFAEIAEEHWLIGTLLIVFGLVLLVADRLGGERRDIVDHVPQWFLDGHRRPPTGRPPGRPVGAKDTYQRIVRRRKLPATT